jgi:hypothetical protein
MRRRPGLLLLLAPPVLAASALCCNAVLGIDTLPGPEAATNDAGGDTSAETSGDALDVTVEDSGTADAGEAAGDAAPDALSDSGADVVTAETSDAPKSDADAADGTTADASSDAGAADAEAGGKACTTAAYTVTASPGAALPTYGSLSGVCTSRQFTPGAGVTTTVTASSSSTIVVACFVNNVFVSLSATSGNTPTCTAYTSSDTDVVTGVASTAFSAYKAPDGHYISVACDMGYSLISTISATRTYVCPPGTGVNSVTGGSACSSDYGVGTTIGTRTVASYADAVGCKTYPKTGTWKPGARTYTAISYVNDGTSSNTDVALTVGLTPKGGTRVTYVENASTGGMYTAGAETAWVYTADAEDIVDVSVDAVVGGCKANLGGNLFLTPFIPSTDVLGSSRMGGFPIGAGTANNELANDSTLQVPYILSAGCAPGSAYSVYDAGAGGQCCSP